MESLGRLARAIDALSEAVGSAVAWLALGMVLAEFATVVLRYIFGLGWVALQESVVYMHATVFMVAAGYTLLHNQHVRIDIVSGLFSKRVQTWIEIVGTLLFLLPMAVVILWLSWPVFLDAYRSHEVSTNAGGLIIWPARLMLPIGFAFLILQGLSELIKRIAFLRGLIPDPSEKDEGPSLEEQLAEELRRERA